LDWDISPALAKTANPTARRRASVGAFIVGPYLLRITVLYCPGESSGIMSGGMLGVYQKGAGF
jgi:hypothetical protein